MVLQMFGDSFQDYAPALLKDLDKYPQSAETKLQSALMFPMAAICSLARVLCRGAAQFEYSMEPVVASIDPSSPDKTQFSDFEVVRMMSLSKAPGSNLSRKMVALVELKFGHFEQVKSDHFSQLLHAAALALQSGMWKDRLLCCVASLTHWHLFLLEVHTHPLGSAYFVISQYHTSVFGSIDYADLPVDSLESFYCHLALGITNLIVSHIM